MTNLVADYAFGHPYRSRQGTGILLDNGTATLYHHHEALSTAPADLSPRDYWRTFQFAHDFPVQVWFFGGAYTQQCMFKRPVEPEPGGRYAPGVINGVVYFGGEAAQGAQIGHYLYTAGEVPIITPPIPPLENEPLNIPLRIRLGHYVYGVVHDLDYAVCNTWVTAWSSVQPEKLPLFFPDTEHDFYRDWGVWRLDMGEGARPMSIREYWLRMMGFGA